MISALEYVNSFTLFEYHLFEKVRSPIQPERVKGNITYFNNWYNQNKSWVDDITYSPLEKYITYWVGLITVQ